MKSLHRNDWVYARGRGRSMIEGGHQIFAQRYPLIHHQGGEWIDGEQVQILAPYMYRDCGWVDVAYRLANAEKTHAVGILVRDPESYIGRGTV